MSTVLAPVHSTTSSTMPYLRATAVELQNFRECLLNAFSSGEPYEQDAATTACHKPICWVKGLSVPCCVT